MKNKTLRDFLKQHNACERGYLFAKDLTLKQFLDNCQRGDWILWLFRRSNPASVKELTLAKGHCANTVRHLLKDERSLKAIDTAIAFGQNKATKQQLDDAAEAAYAAAYAADAAAAAAYAAADAAEAYAAAYAAAAAAAYAAGAAVAADAAAAAAYAAAADAAAYVAKKENYKKTADICRKYLPISIWNINN